MDQFLVEFGFLRGILSRTASSVGEVEGRESHRLNNRSCDDTGKLARTGWRSSATSSPAAQAYLAYNWLRYQRRSSQLLEAGAEAELNGTWNRYLPPILRKNPWRKMCL